ncbi:MAG: Ig-like domain-containing protein [Gammaproteobacteria bacterium]|nr:Ig-like domain-containing protein [Gammaproteobacteria bacterium]
MSKKMFLSHHFRLFQLSLFSILVMAGCSDNSKNAAPVAIDSVLDVMEDESATAIMAAEDPDGDELEFSIKNNPGKGELTILDQVTGRYEYKPNANMNGEDQFAFLVSDGDSESSGVVTIQIRARSDAPQAVDDFYDLGEGMSKGANLLENDSDPDGDSITLNTTAIRGPTNGTLTLDADGGFTYTHDGSETTSDSFIYEIIDAGGLTAQATVTLIINLENDAPIADEDQESTNKGVAVNINVTANDNDPDSTINVSTISIVSPPSGGSTAVVNGLVRYTPNASFVGQDSFDYTVKDRSGLVSNAARVTIMVNHNNPVAEANCSFAEKQSQQTGTLKASDNDSVDAGQMVFKLGSNGEVAENNWLNTTYGRVRITNKTSGAFEFEHTDLAGLGKRDVFDFQVSVEGETSDTAKRSFLIEPRIMPLGDSITDGISEGINGDPNDSLPSIPARNGYRKSLYSSLTSSSYKIDFVGSKMSGDGNDNNHEGNSGKSADWILGNVDGFLSDNPAEVVLLHVGTNDLNIPISQSPEGVKNDVQGILNNINSWAVAQNRDIYVLTAKIIDFNPENSDVAALNSLVTNMVASGNWSNLTVSMVDQYSALADSNDWGDELHPSAQGYNKMANTWKSALTPVLDAMCVIE